MKAILLISLLFTAIIVHAQVLEQSFTIDLSNGDTAVTSVNITGFVSASIQIVSIGLDAATATFRLQKSNDLVNFGDIPDASGTFDAGDSMNFVEFSYPFGNTALRLVILTNTVTEGLLRINLNLIQ